MTGPVPGPVTGSATGRPVVLALGDDGSVAAVHYAVEHARRRSSPLHLVLVVAPGAAGRDLDHELELRSASGLARDRAAGGPAVSAALVPGTDVASLLVEAAADADTLVLGRPATFHTGRMLDGSVLAVVAARSPAQVVVVPPGWRPRPHEDPVVVVGVQDHVEAPALLDAAAAAAQDLQARVVVVHAQRAGRDDAVVVAGDARHRASCRTVHTSLGPGVEQLRCSWPDLQVDLEVHHGHPEAVLVTNALGG